MRVTTNGVIVIGVVTMIAIMVAAIAYQQFSWWVFPFGLLFLTIFAGILWLCFLDHREDRFRRASEGKFPDEPWMRSKRWRTDNMTSRSKPEFWGSLAFTLILGVFALSGIVSLQAGLPEGNYWVLLNLIPIVGALYFALSTYFAWRTWRLERYVNLISETRPAWIGSKFSAVIKVVGVRRTDQVEAWLEHLKVVRREESDGVAFEKVVDQKLTGQTEEMSGGQIRISVDIPENTPATSWNDDEQESWWDFVIVVGLPEKKITLRYEVPVADPALH
ncbi:hypothetical protein [Roseibium sp. RKSG952]|uniref:hypothetical protein n=1 Tax=Roseibium sp. RKSG952 TaxID=2529384 RepID=UPI0012BCA17A|nr:hypothetical protein [Roseibium sp. RKSG952]MTI02236.1 hypothetical protein [Roseibium sp. RKSG952]